MIRSELNFMADRL
jgi:hypothetical protein